MDWKCGDITRAEYLRMKAKFEQQAEDLKQFIENLELEMMRLRSNLTLKTNINECWNLFNKIRIHTW